MSACFTSPACRLRRAFAAIASLLAVSLSAHPEIEAALERLNARIAVTPADAELYLERGELYAKHHEWLQAEANYLRAAELAPALPRLDAARGALALANGASREAREHLDRALVINPADAEALIFRARARAKLNDRRGALTDLDTAVRLIANPRPELFLERADLFANTTDAIRSLDAAIARIGPVHTLQLRALELEISAAQVNAALARLETITAQSERKEHWLKRRGDLLVRAGRMREARAAYEAALAAIAALPSWLRESPDTAQLVAELTQLTPLSS